VDGVEEMKKITTIEEAEKISGFRPSDPEFYKIFIDGLNADLELNGEAWVKEHREMIRAGWEVAETLM
jgi:hypothetical protein